MCSLVDDPASESTITSATTEQLELEITELAAHINAATSRWLQLVAEFDRREGWAEWGCKSCAHWLSYRCGISAGTAREQVRVACAAGKLPAIGGAFSRGELSYSQVRALTRVATPATDSDLLEVARHATASQLETIVRGYGGVIATELATSEPAHRRRFVRCEHDDDGSLLIKARLPPEEGELILKALEAGRDALRQRAGSGEDVSAETSPESVSAETPPAANIAAVEHPDGRDGEEAPGEREAASNADALLLMAQSLLSSGPAERTGADSYQVVVHVDVGTLAADDAGDCAIEGAGPLEPETARRLACDASVVRIIERDGRPLSVGRKTRSVPPQLRRALRSRDGACRFPGCSQRRFLHAHHLDHWARGGSTELDNLIHLCAFHHRLVHEGGYTVAEGPRGGGVLFRRPDGRPLQAVPPRPRGRHGELGQLNRRRGLRVHDRSCVPSVSHDRFRPAWVVDSLVEADPRFRE